MILGGGGEKLEKEKNPPRATASMKIFVHREGLSKIFLSFPEKGHQNFFFKDFNGGKYTLNLCCVFHIVCYMHITV